jgi:hypothetical protein
MQGLVYYRFANMKSFRRTLTVTNYASVPEQMVPHVVLPCPFLPWVAQWDAALRVEAILGIPVHMNSVSERTLIWMMDSSYHECLIERAPWILLNVPMPLQTRSADLKPLGCRLTEEQCERYVQQQEDLLDSHVLHPPARTR